MKSDNRQVYGMLVEFGTAVQLLEAVRAARKSGFSMVEAYSPFPVEGLAEAVGFRHNHVPFLTLAGGIAGGAATYILLWYTAVIDYPLNIGGRPLHSWPSFIPPTFEITILGAALPAVVGMLLMNGLPRLRHPLFEVPEFDLATRNRFFLFLPASDSAYTMQDGRRWLENLSPLMVKEVTEARS